MPITLNLPPETESGLLAQANFHGLSLQDFILTTLTKQARNAQCDDADRLVDEVFDAVPIPLGVGRDAAVRENWYR